MALNSRDVGSIVAALGMLEPQLPLDPYQAQALDRRLREFIDEGVAARSPELARAVAHFLYKTACIRAEAVSPFIPALVSFMETDLATTGAHAYYTLMIVAEEAPDLLSPFSGLLVEKLKSNSYAVQTLAVRIIARLAVKCPAVMSAARYDLWNLYKTSADGPLKIEAQKALHVLFSRGQPGDAGADGLRKVVAMDTHRFQSAVSRLFFSIWARFLNFWRLLVKRGTESSEMARIADDLREVARWVEARFPPPAGYAVSAVTFPDRSMRLFPDRVPSECDQITLEVTAPAPRPSRERCEARPEPEPVATAREFAMRSSVRKYTSRSPAGRPGAAVTPARLNENVLLGEIRKDIDDSLRMTSGRTPIKAETQAKPAPDKKRAGNVPYSRPGHYVKKRVHSAVRPM